MPHTEHRSETRDRLLLLAEARLDGQGTGHRIKVRNLSEHGMMGEGAILVRRGDTLAVRLRNIGWVDGAVAWVHSNRFGLAFASAIDAAAVRRPPLAARLEVPDFVLDIAEAGPDPEAMRKL